MKRTDKKGFTLVELVVVIAVLLILAAIAIPVVTGIINKAHISADDSNAQALEAAVKYAIAHNEIGVDKVNSFTAALALSGIQADVDNLKPKQGAHKFVIHYTGNLATSTLRVTSEADAFSTTAGTGYIALLDGTEVNTALNAIFAN